jgi:hypothetical protein
MPAPPRTPRATKASHHLSCASCGDQIGGTRLKRPLEIPGRGLVYVCREKCEERLTRGMAEHGRDPYDC